MMTIMNHLVQTAPDCKVGNPECWDIDSIQEYNYDLRCESWKEGKYSWAGDKEKEEKLLMK